MNECLWTPASGLHSPPSMQLALPCPHQAPSGRTHCRLCPVTLLSDPVLGRKDLSSLHSSAVQDASATVPPDTHSSLGISDTQVSFSCFPGTLPATFLLPDPTSLRQVSLVPCPVLSLLLYLRLWDFPVV